MGTPKYEQSGHSSDSSGSGLSSSDSDLFSTETHSDSNNSISSSGSPLSSTKIMKTTKVKFRVKLKSPDTNKHFSSNDYENILLTGLTAFDLEASYAIRYPALEKDFNAMHNVPRDTNGKTLDYMRDHSIVGIITAVAMGFVAFFASALAYFDLKKTKARKSYQFTYKQIAGEFEPTTKESDDKKASTNNQNNGLEINEQEPLLPTTPIANEYNVDKQVYKVTQLPPLKNFSSKTKQKTVLEDINTRINDYISKDNALKETYKSIIAEEVKENEKVVAWDVVMEKIEPTTENRWRFWQSDWTPPSIIKGVVKAADNNSTMLVLISYSYWIFIITAAIITGIYGGGFNTLTNIISILLPLTAGCTFLGIKIKNWFANHNAPTKEQSEFNAIVLATQLDKEEENAIGKKIIPSKTTAKKTIPGITLFTAANAFVLGTIGTYVAWQYNMWYLTDFLIKIFAVACDIAASSIGIGIFVTALVAGAREVYKVYENYLKEKKDGVQPQLSSFELLKQQRESIKDLEKQLKTKQDNLGTTSVTALLDAKIQEAQIINAKPEPTFFNTVGRFFGKLLNFANFAMTGAFVARTIFVAGTGFLIPGLAAAVCLSNPFTIGILVAAGIAWASYRYYQYRKELSVQRLIQGNEYIELLERKINILTELESKTRSSTCTTIEGLKASSSPESNVEVLVDEKISQPLAPNSPPESNVAVLAVNASSDTKNSQPPAQTTSSATEADSSPVDPAPTKNHTSGPT